MSVERAYNELLKNRKAKKVIVAVIDAGIDINHEDIKDVIWVNKDEIPDNNIDDDGNGFIDDVNGWNFLGESYNETLEMTRLIRDNLNKNRRYDSAKKTIKSKLDDRKKNIDFYNNLISQIENASEMIKTFLGKDSFSDEDLENIMTNDSIVLDSKKMIQYYNSIDVDVDYLREGIEYFSDQINYHYNINFNGRDIVGDNIYDINDTNYGDSRVLHSKKSENHGTHVAGIIAGIRINNMENRNIIVTGGSRNNGVKSCPKR